MPLINTTSAKEIRVKRADLAEVQRVLDDQARTKAAVADLQIAYERQKAMLFAQLARNAQRYDEVKAEVSKAYGIEGAGWELNRKRGVFLHPGVVTPDAPGAPAAGVNLTPRRKKA